MAGPPRPVPDPKGGEATSNDFNSCGPRAAAAWVRAFGGDLSTLFVPDVANAQEIAYGVNHMGQGFHATVELGDPIGIAGVLIPQGRGLIIGVNTTPDCIPTDYATGIRHWLNLYTVDGWCFNVWNQNYTRYTNLSQAHNPLMGTVAIWRDNWTPPDPPQPIDTEGDDMGAFALGWTAKRPSRDDGDSFWFDQSDGVVWHAYEVGGKRTPGQPENLGATPAGATVVGVTGVHSGLPPAFTEVRVMTKDSTGSIRVWAKALPWTGGHGAWSQIG